MIEWPAIFAILVSPFTWCASKLIKSVNDRNIGIIIPAKCGKTMLIPRLQSSVKYEFIDLDQDLTLFIDVASQVRITEAKNNNQYNAIAAILIPFVETYKQRVRQFNGKKRIVYLSSHFRLIEAMQCAAVEAFVPTQKYISEILLRAGADAIPLNKHIEYRTNIDKIAESYKCKLIESPDELLSLFKTRFNLTR